MMAISLNTVSKVLKVSSVFAIATGLLDACLGTSMIPGLSGALATRSPVTALVDSQLRFLGTMWAGYGVMLWWASNDLHTRKVPLGLLGIVMFSGGIGRLLSCLKHGLGAPWVKVAIGIELVGPVALYILSN